MDCCLIIASTNGFSRPCARAEPEELQTPSPEQVGGLKVGVPEYRKQNHTCQGMTHYQVGLEISTLDWQAQMTWKNQSLGRKHVFSTCHSWQISIHPDSLSDKKHGATRPLALIYAPISNVHISGGPWGPWVHAHRAHVGSILACPVPHTHYE